jgi:hypothetical protein
MANELETFKNNYAQSIYGIDSQTAISKGICIDCKSAIDQDKLSAIDMRSYMISAICPLCWDKTFKDD